MHKYFVSSYIHINFFLVEKVSETLEQEDTYGNIPDQKM